MRVSTESMMEIAISFKPYGGLTVEEERTVEGVNGATVTVRVAIGE